MCYWLFVNLPSSLVVLMPSLRTWTLNSRGNEWKDVSVFGCVQTFYWWCDVLEVKTTNPSILPPRRCRSRACPTSCSSARSCARLTWATTACSQCRRASASWRRWRSWSCGATGWSACRWSWASAGSSRGRAWWWRRTSSTPCPPRSRSSSGKLIRNQPELLHTHTHPGVHTPRPLTPEPERFNGASGGVGASGLVWSCWIKLPIGSGASSLFFPLRLCSFPTKHLTPSHHHPVLMVV